VLAFVHSPNGGSEVPKKTPAGVEPALNCFAGSGRAVWLQRQSLLESSADDPSGHNPKMHPYQRQIDASNDALEGIRPSISAELYSDVSDYIN
jgi:hypothetical protein